MGVVRVGAARRVVGVGAARRVGARKRDWLARMDLFDHQDCVPNFAPMYAIWPLVLCTAQGGGDGRRGIFVELGANDGLAETNTLSMERCLGWRGVLIEGNVALFSRLRQSRSNQSNVLVHSAVSSHCSADGTIRFSDAPSETAGIVDADGFTPAGGRHRQSSPVPCKPLRSILDSALSWFGARRVDFASIDTEGSEDLVISSLLAPAQHAQSAAELSGSAGTLPGSSPESNALRAPSTDAHAVLPTVLLVEAVGPVDKDARVENSLLGAGYVRANELEGTLHIVLLAPVVERARAVWAPYQA